MYISDLQVDNYRSLKNVSIADMHPICLLFGVNGAGKSTILSLIQDIFSPKQVARALPDEPVVYGHWYRGIASGFANNFRGNEPCVVTFGITLTLNRSEIADDLKAFADAGVNIPATFPADGIKLRIKGTFEPNADDISAANINLHVADLHKILLFDHTKRGTDIWLPHDKVLISDRAGLVENLLARFTNCFTNIGVARFLHKETMTQTQDIQEQDRLEVFKTQLFNAKQSVGQVEQSRFRQIRKLFSKLTSWGEFDFAKRRIDDDDLDVMSWDDQGLWLPISMRGAGAEQLLVIISEVVLRGSQIIGIEELESNLDEENQRQLMVVLREMISDGGYQVGQIIATAHSCFYGFHLPDYEKKHVVRSKTGDTGVDPWTAVSRHSLFDYLKEVRQPKKPKAK